MRLLTSPEKHVEFIRPLYQGYSDWLDSSTKKIQQKTKLSFLPRKCAISGKSLFMKKAVMVKETDLIFRNRATICWYDPQHLTILVMKL